MGKDRNSEGRFTQQHTDDDVVAAVRAHEPAATSEVANELGIARQSADYRLRKLRDAGRVSSKKIAASLVWFTAGRGRETDADDVDAPDDVLERDPEPSVPDNDPDEHTPAQATTDVRLQDVDFPTGRDRDECVAAVHAARDHLRDHGPATMRELVADVMPKHPVGYDVPDLEPGDRYRGAWWRKVVKPGLEAVDDVEKPPTGGSEWRYTGEA